MNNLHISLTSFVYESRILKQTESITKLKFIEKVFIAALKNETQSSNETISKSIQLKRFNLYTRKLGGNIVIQSIKYLEFFIRIYFFYKSKKIAIINIHSLSLLPLGVFLKYIFKAKLIYDTHELETEVDNLHGLRKKLSKIVEKILIKYTDHVFVVSNKISDWYKKEYLIPKPTVLLNAPKNRKIKKTNYFRKFFKLNKDQTIFIYQGILIKGRGIDILLETFKNRSDHKAVIIFMGYGELENKIIKMAKKYETIFFHHAVKPNEVYNFTASADIGVSLIENTCLSYYFCMPNKLFEYIMTGLPVIVSNCEEMSAFVYSYNIGWVLKKENPISLNNIIDKILNSDISKYKKNTHTAAFDNSWVHQEKKMISDFIDLMGKD